MDNSSPPPTSAIYAVRDTVAQALLGGLQLHKHEASAIRTFTDIVLMPDSMVRLHPNDYEFVRLGYLVEHDGSVPQIIPDFAVVLTAAAVVAVQSSDNVGAPS